MCGNRQLHSSRQCFRSLCAKRPHHRLAGFLAYRQETCFTSLRSLRTHLSNYRTIALMRQTCTHAKRITAHRAARLPSSPPRLMAGRSAGVQKCVIKHNFNTRLHIPLKRRALARSFPQGGRGVFRRTKGACSPFGNPYLADMQPIKISFIAKSRNLTKIVPPIYHGKPHPAEGERAHDTRAAPVLPCE